MPHSQFPSTIVLNGVEFTADNFADIPVILKLQGKEWVKDIVDFLGEWFNEHTYIKVQTSGTTGEPKPLMLSKRAMVESAKRTLEVFKLDNGTTLLNVLSAKYIAGKMMFVRAMVGQLNLHIVEPSTHFAEEVESHFDFVAIVPNQIETIMELQKRQKVSENTKVLIGGAPLTEKNMDQLKHLKVACYQSYASTEMASHVAIKKLNGADQSSTYKATPDVRFSTTPNSCLVVHAPFLDEKMYETTDVVELVSETEFRWLGRVDHVINSAGIKIHPEVIENQIADLIQQTYYITAANDEVYGQVPILVIQGDFKDNELQQLLEKVNLTLDKYHKIRAVKTVQKIELTPTGKIKRLRFV